MLIHLGLHIRPQLSEHGGHGVQDGEIVPLGVGLNKADARKQVAEVSSDVLKDIHSSHGHVEEVRVSPATPSRKVASVAEARIGVLKDEVTVDRRGRER